LSKYIRKATERGGRGEVSPTADPLKQTGRQPLGCTNTQPWTERKGPPHEFRYLKLLFPQGWPEPIPIRNGKPAGIHPRLSGKTEGKNALRRGIFCYSLASL